MADIPGWVFMAIGAVVIMISAIQYERMLFFVFVGIALLFYGLIKFFITRKPTKKEEKRTVKKPREPIQPYYQPLTQKEQGSAPQERGYPTMCPNCGSPLRTTDTFCARCGARVR